MEDEPLSLQLLGMNCCELDIKKKKLIVHKFDMYVCIYIFLSCIKKMRIHAQVY